MTHLRSTVKVWEGVHGGEVLMGARNDAAMG